MPMSSTERSKKMREKRRAVEKIRSSKKELASEGKNKIEIRKKTRTEIERDSRERSKIRANLLLASLVDNVKKQPSTSTIVSSCYPKINTLENEMILPDSGTTQASQFRENDTPVCIDANITVPYIKQEIEEPVTSVISQTLPCLALSQERAQDKLLTSCQGSSSHVNPNPLENEVILPDCGTTQHYWPLQFRANNQPVCLDANITVPYIKQEIIEPVVSQTLPCHVLTTQANDTPMCLDANITVPYIKQEIVQPVFSQTLPCHTLTTQALQFKANDMPKPLNANITVPYIKQEIVEPVISQTLPCHTLNQEMVVTERILPQRSSIDLPYDAVCTERIDEPVPNFLPEKTQWIVKKKVLLSTGGCNGKTADSCGIKRSDVGRSAKEENALAGKKLMTLGEANCTSKKLYKTCFAYLSSQHKPKPQLDQSIKNSRRNLLIRSPSEPNVFSHTVLSGELIPETIKVEEEFEVVKNQFHESPEAVISYLNQKCNSSMSGSGLNPVTTRIVRSPSTRFMNSCTSSVTTFASTLNKTVRTNTSALNTALSSTSTTPILISSYAQPSIPSIQYVSSLPINSALNVPMIHVPPWPAAKSNSDLIFNSILPTQSNQSPSMVTSLPFVAHLNNSSSNVSSSLPIQTVVLNPTINSTLCDTNLGSTFSFPVKPISLKVENVFKDADFLPNKNNCTLSDIYTNLSDTKSTTLLNTKSTTLSVQSNTSFSDRINTILCGRKSITLSDGNNATFSDRNKSYVHDRNTNALFDRDFTIVTRRCSNQRKKALRRKQYHMMQEQKKIWLLGKMYKKL